MWESGCIWHRFLDDEGQDGEPHHEMSQGQIYAWMKQMLYDSESRTWVDEFHFH